MPGGIGCKDCTSGALHSGTPVGRIETLYGLPTYITLPSEGVTPKGIIVIIPDAFGWELANSRILADKYAQKGHFVVYLPDFMNGHYLPEQMLSVFADFELDGAYATKIRAGLRAARHFPPFFLYNRMSVVWPRILSFFDSIHADHTTSSLPVGAAGFCWGGKFTAILCNDSFEGKPNARIDAGFVAHPSQLDIPSDIRDIVKPLSVAVGDNDMQLGTAGLEKLKTLLDVRTTQNGLKQEVVVYPDAKHGFAVRGDPLDETQKRYGMEAEQQAIEWFSQTLIKAA